MVRNLTQPYHEIFSNFSIQTTPRFACRCSNLHIHEQATHHPKFDNHQQKHLEFLISKSYLSFKEEAVCSMLPKLSTTMEKRNDDDGSYCLNPLDPLNIFIGEPLKRNEKDGGGIHSWVHLLHRLTKPIFFYMQATKS